VNYDEALAFLAGLTRFGVNLGLGRIEELLERLGNPHLALKVLHVGGTNGKGSTVAMLSSILKAAGYRAGAFTSPHLHSYTERFQINGAEITRERLAELIGEIRPHLESMVMEGYEHPTEFEVGTALAFLYFFRERVDFLVMEVGLGGEIDSTNVARSIISVITNVAMDHMDYLGNSVWEIARVKAGIIKPGVPVVTAAAGEGLEVIERVCREKHSPLTVVGRDVSWEEISVSTSGQRFLFKGFEGTYDIELPLLGRHQQVNAAAAAAAAEILMRKGVAVSREHVRQGLAGTRWPGRLEIMCREPLVVIDGAHNPHAAGSLSRALEDFFPGRKVVLVIGMLEDKERAKVVGELAPLARAVVVTRPDSPRAGNWRELASMAGRHVNEVYQIENVRQAVDSALSLAGPADLVCVTGSLYMIAEAREVLLSRFC